MHKVVVIGGSVIDLFLYPHHEMKLRDSNPGYLKRSLGGVGRNIAENLTRLGINVTLITPLGQDAYHTMILDHAQTIGLDLIPIPIKETPTYISLIDEHNEDLIGVALMDEVEAITKDQILKYQQVLDHADFIILDTNFSVGVLKAILEKYHNKVYIDAISGNKALKLKDLLPLIHTLKMNLIEAQKIAGISGKPSEELTALSNFFIEQGTKEIFITLGEKGVYYANKDKSITRLSPPVNIKNSAGAGDAFFSGVLYAKLNNKDELAYGIANAYLNLTDEKAVCHILTKELIEHTVKELER